VNVNIKLKGQKDGKKYFFFPVKIVKKCRATVPAGQEESASATELQKSQVDMYMS
jgi:hypothetical protein